MYLHEFFEGKACIAQKVLHSSLYNTLDFARIVYNYISLNGPLSLLQEPFL
jgi:hypothetical protein